MASDAAALIKQAEKEGIQSRENGVGGGLAREAAKPPIEGRGGRD